MQTTHFNNDLDQLAGNLGLIYCDLLLYPGVPQKLHPPCLLKHLHLQPH